VAAPTGLHPTRLGPLDCASLAWGPLVPNLHPLHKLALIHREPRGEGRGESFFPRLPHGCALHSPSLWRGVLGSGCGGPGAHLDPLEGASAVEPLRRPQGPKRRHGGAVHEHAEVALLSRNIVIAGASEGGGSAF